MSILEKIRSKSALLVGIVGLALVIFILESLLGSGSALFSSQDTLVGEIDGEKVDYVAFNKKVNEQVSEIQKQNPNIQIDEKTKEQIVESVWNQLINEKVIKVQYNKLGLSVSKEELFDLMLVHPHQYVVQQLSDQKTGKVYEAFATPEGTLDLAKLRQWVSQMNAEQDKFWKQLEKSILDVRVGEKYANLVKKGIYTTTAEAKDDYIAQNNQIKATFVVKRYSSVSDSVVTISDDEIKEFYNKHQNDYKVKTSTRNIEYISYDVMPSQGDYEALMADAKRVKDEFKTKTANEDSSYIAQETDGGQVIIGSYGKKNMVISDSSVYTSPKGSVFGPVVEGTMIKVYKVTDIQSLADSAKVRHILIGLQSQRAQTQRTPEAAKRMADSLVVLIKSKQVKFDTLVKTISDDMGSIDKGGDYGWFDENKGFVEPFMNAGLQGTVGNITVVPTQFGFHIIEVLNVAKTRHNSYKVAQISKLIAPSGETNQEYYKTAIDFAGKNQTADAFAKAIETGKLNKRLAANIKEGEKSLPGLDEAKDLVRWVYKAKKGEISQVFEFKDRFVIAHLTEINEKGVAPLENVKEEVKLKAIREKKAELFMKEFTTKGGSSIEDIATKMTLTAEQAENLNFATYNLPSVGREDVLIGAISVMKAGTISKPIKGDNGVFVVKIETATNTVLPSDFKAKQKEMEQMASRNVDFELFEALKEKANIEDHRGKFDF